MNMPAYVYGKLDPDHTQNSKILGGPVQLQNSAVFYSFKSGNIFSYKYKQFNCYYSYGFLNHGITMAQ